MRALQEDSAFVIHIRKYRENSCLADFFCLNNGRVKLIVRSPKKNRQYNHALLQPCQPLKITFSNIEPTGLGCLKECISCGKAKNISPPNFFSGLYVNELLYHLYHSSEGAPALFASYISLLDALESNEELYVRLREFEFSLISVLGYSLDFSIDGRPFVSSQYYKLTSDWHFEAVTDSALDGRMFAGQDLLDIRQGRFNNKSSKEITRALLNYLLKGRELKSRALYLDYLRRT